MTFTTILQAIDQKDGQLKIFAGPRIYAISWKDAELKIKDRGYLKIDGLLVSEIDEETGEKQQFIFWN